MSIADITSALWRRRALFAITFVACMAVVAIITAVVPRTYRATAVLYVGTNSPRLDTSEGDQLTRTFSSIASNPNIAEAVLPRLDTDLTRSELLDKMSFTPVERTQLLEISAEDRSAEEARQLANTYSEVFTANVGEQVDAGNAPVSVAINQPAVVPNSPVRPKPPIYLGIGLVLSFLLATAVTAVRDRFDRRLRISPRDQAIMGEPVLARIPVLFSAIEEEGGDRALVAPLRAARILGSDAFRLMRTNIDLADGPPARTIVITSPSTGEGKTTIAAQLALTTAADGDSTIVVDADLRGAALVSTGFGTEPGSSAGLAEYLAGDRSLEEVVVTVPELPDLKVVSAGGPVAEPGPLLRSDKLRRLLRTASEGSEWVIIDTPPIAVGDDALVASTHADGVVVVVDEDETRTHALMAGLGRLYSIQARVLGIVVNRSTPMELDAYQYLAAEPREETPAAGNVSGIT